MLLIFGLFSFDLNVHMAGVCLHCFKVLLIGVCVLHGVEVFLITACFAWALTSC